MSKHQATAPKSPSGSQHGSGDNPEARYVPPERSKLIQIASWLDRVLAAILLMLLWPVLVLVALLVKLDCPSGPIFYKQERVGMNRRQSGDAREHFERRRSRGEGQPFRIWKFRTMVPDAEAKTGPVWASENDPRITPIGRFLRKTRLDELPQLVNVVKGEMRLVGPRPERPHFVNDFAESMPEYRKRLSVPPGITGLAQVEHEYDTDVEDVRKKLRYDLFYIENRRPTMDLKILIKTLAVVITRKGAR
ncbi:MAG: sugar transferase [Candidatus Eisenbacteria bacterium]|uniref:Sugar transferase n=1 Tax=Eiseniibacteriota bacterium TaxID=2212470 RepID=A0A7Y2E7L6_UNCEI|nr:sugar transferase [Candidatus Eisenbacteria bacterium]